MIPANYDESDQEERFNQVLLTYLEATQEGRALDRQQLLSAHPEFAIELSEFFALRDEMDRLATPLREVALARSLPSRLPASPEPASEGFRAPFGQEPPLPVVGSSELGQIGEFRLIREIGRGGMNLCLHSSLKEIRQ